jgi:peptidoglycan/LPS O-acetylase OafA/YrhL
MQDSRPFFSRVEALRGSGAVMIATWHMSGWALNGVSLLPHEPWPLVGPLQNAIGRLELWMLPAHAALMMFFVISGLVLRISLEYGLQQPLPAALRFLTARLFRIYPIIIVSMLVAGLAHGWQIPAGQSGEGAPVTPATLVANLLLIDVSLNSTLWAIQLEVLIAPIIVLLYFVERRFGPWSLAAIALATSVLSFSGAWGWQPLCHNMFAFVLGMLVPTLGRTLVQRQSLPAANKLLLGCVLGMFMTGPVFGFFSQFAAFFEGYLAFVLVALAAYRIDLGALRLLDGRLIRLVGLSSGSYYVLHMPLLVWIAPPIALFIAPVWSEQMPAAVAPVVLIIAAAVLTVPAALGYYAIEAPGIAIGRGAARKASLLAAARTQAKV